MKLKLLLLLVLTITVCKAQLKPVLITLNNGEKLKGIGKRKAFTFKYKADDNAKPQEFEFSTIKSVEIELSRNEITIYRCFQTKESDRFILVAEIISGNKAALFSTTFTYSPAFSGGMGTGGMGTGGMGMGMGGSVTHYYVKKTNEDRLTDLGEYNPLLNNLKGKVKEYFSDCKSLLEKLEKSEFRVRDGLEDIVNYYNKSCE